MRRRWLAAAAGALALTVAAPAARAGGCVIDAVSNVSWASYDVLASSPTDSTGSVTVRCLVSLSITVDLAKGGSGSYASRSLARTGGGVPLAYNLFTDAAHTLVWGDGTGTTSHYGPVIGLLTDFTIPIYARIPAAQDVITGTYTDTIVVTLNF